MALLNSFDNLNIPLEIIVDRWLAKVQSETIWEEQQTIFDDINPTDTVTDPNHRTLHNTTRVDLQDNRGHYIKFKKDPL